VSPIHLGLGAVVATSVVGIFAWRQLRDCPNAEHLALANEFEDTKCVMNFFDGTTHRFSAKKDDRYTHTFKAPKIGFVIMRCETATSVKEAPGHFHLVEGGLTDAKFAAEGEIEARYWDGERY
jgi:hypothetical protein